MLAQYNGSIFDQPQMQMALADVQAALASIQRGPRRCQDDTAQLDALQRAFYGSLQRTRPSNGRPARTAGRELYPWSVPRSDDLRSVRQQHGRRVHGHQRGLRTQLDGW
jgi:hypothetical protein